MDSNLLEAFHWTMEENARNRVICAKGDRNVPKIFFSNGNRTCAVRFYEVRIFAKSVCQRIRDTSSQR